MNNKILFFALYIVINCSLLIGQKNINNESVIDKKYQSDYTNARLLMYKNEFNNALNLLKKWEEKYPDNANLIYNIGVCLFNSQDKLSSEVYFDKASKNVTLNYIDNYQTTEAPIDVYAYLAEIYHLKYNFDKAIEYYNLFIEKSDNKIMIDSVKWLRQKSYTAQALINAPAVVKVDNLGQSINTQYPEYSPVFDFKDSILYFTSRREGTTGGKLAPDGKYFEDIYFSKLEKKENQYIWTGAKPIPGAVNSKYHEATVSIGNNGKILFIYEGAIRYGDIYYSELNQQNEWSFPIEFPVINSPYRETHASLSFDGRTLYFTSDRPGGYGGLDIWKTELGENGWLKPENLGPIINTKYNEEAPFILPDGVTLYFSSQGHDNMGGYDIFFTNLTEDGFWQTPTNLGYPINSPGNDVFYYPSPDEKYAFFSSADIKGYGDQDLYLMNIISIRANQIKLIVRTIDAFSFLPVKSDIKIHNINNNDLKYELVSDESGYVEVFLNYGEKYEFTASASEYSVATKKIEILNDDPRSVVLMDIFLEKAEIVQQNQEIAEDIETFKEPVKEPLKIGESFILRNIYFDFDKATLRPQSIEELDHLYQFLVNNPTAIVEISAHTDRIGSYEYNINLSKRRAQAVVDYLINKGIDSKRLIAKGYGFTKPVATNSTEEGRQLNRRVEFKILSYDDKELESILNPPKSFYIIGASTIDYDDAEYIRNNFIKKGFKNATIINDNENKRFRIAYENYPTKQEAEQRLNELKAITGQADLWIIEY